MYIEQHESNIDDFNAQTRREIESFLDKHGGICYLGKINVYAGDVEHYFWENTRCRIRNFEACFMVPGFDQQLNDLIVDRNKSSFTGISEGYDPTKNYETLEAIMKRIDELGGKYLNWV